MAEYIDREQAIKAICEYSEFLWKAYHEPMQSGYEYIIRGLPIIREVEELKHGRWVESPGSDKVVPFFGKDYCPKDSCFCSECGAWLSASDEYAVVGKFCPNCGADMRGDKE